MKKNHLIILVLIQFIAFSCTNSQGTYDEFVKGGEHVYRAVAKDLIGRSGNKSAKLSWKLTHPYLVDKCIICNGNQLIAELPIEYKDTVKMEYTLKGLTENAYTFSVYSVDKDGNKSIKSDVIVDVYGDKYIRTLRTNREIKDVLRADDGSICIYLNSLSSVKNIATNIIYTTSNNLKKTIRVENKQNIIITDVLNNSDYSLEDLWLPNSTAFEEFKGPAKYYKSNMLPQSSRRNITDIYRNINNQVNVTLSKSSSDIIKSTINLPGKSLDISPTINSVLLNNVPTTGELILVTAMQPKVNGPLFFSEKIIINLADIPLK